MKFLTMHFFSELVWWEMNEKIMMYRTNFRLIHDEKKSLFLIASRICSIVCIEIFKMIIVLIFLMFHLFISIYMKEQKESNTLKEAK